MKKILFALMLTMFFVPFAFGATVNYRATWDANSEPDLAGYKLYLTDDASGASLGIIDVGNVTTYNGSLTVPDNEVTKIKGEITAYDESNNESEKGTPAYLTVDFEPPSPPGGLIMQIIEIIALFFKAILNFFA